MKEETDERRAHLVGTARQPTWLHGGRHCGGVRGCGPFAASPDAFAASDAETLNYYNWAQYVNPKTYPLFEKAAGIKVKKSFYDSNETLHAKLKGGARGYDLVCPTGYMTKQLIAEKLLEPLDWSKLKTRQEERRPEVPQHAGRPEEHVLGRQGLGHDGLHVPHGQDQGAADDVERVRRPDEEVREDDDGRLLARVRSARSRRCSATRTTPRTGKSWTRSRRYCST